MVGVLTGVIIKNIKKNKQINNIAYLKQLSSLKEMRTATSSASNKLNKSKINYNKHLPDLKSCIIIS